MEVQANLNIPEHVAGKLATGEYERVGGVVRDRASGKVQMWLRETNPSPQIPQRLPTSPAHNALNMVGSVASVLNLGATIGYGALTLKKLGEMDKKLDVIDAKITEVLHRIDKVQWSIDMGFAQTLQALDDIRQYQEVELAGALNSAAKTAWSCQFLEPGSVQRVTRIENALSTVDRAKEELILHSERQMAEAQEAMLRLRKVGPSFAIGKDICVALQRLRQTISACTLSASISAESGDLYSAQSMLKREHELLNGFVEDFVREALRPADAIYATLLSGAFSDVVSANRIDFLIKRYDPQCSDLSDALDLARNFSARLTSDSQSYYERKRQNSSPLFGASAVVWAASAAISKDLNLEGTGEADAPVKNDLTPELFNLIEGISEDLERMHGYSLEYESADDMALSIEEYRSMLAVNEDPSENNVVFFTASA